VKKIFEIRLPAQFFEKKQKKRYPEKNFKKTVCIGALFKNATYLIPPAEFTRRNQ
jgi:hypothetical protein